MSDHVERMDDATAYEREYAANVDAAEAIMKSSVSNKEMKAELQRLMDALHTGEDAGDPVYEEFTTCAQKIRQYRAEVERRKDNMPPTVAQLVALMKFGLPRNSLPKTRASASACLDRLTELKSAPTEKQLKVLARIGKKAATRHEASVLLKEWFMQKRLVPPKGTVAPKPKRA